MSDGQTNPHELDVAVTREKDAALVRADGEVTAFSSPHLREAVHEAAAEEPRLVVIDLSGTSYVDSSGVATLVEALQITGKYGGKLVLSGMNERVRGVFEIARLDALFTVTETVEEALGS